MKHVLKKFLNNRYFNNIPLIHNLPHLPGSEHFIDRLRKFFGNALISHSRRKLGKKQRFFSQRREYLFLVGALFIGFFIRADKIAVNGNGDRQIPALVVHFKLRQAGAVFRQRSDSVRKAGVPALNELQFLEEVAYPTVAVNPRADIVGGNALV